MRRLPVWTSAAALGCVIAAGALRLPLCRFTEEEITVDVWPSEIRVRGLYRYENPFPIRIRQGLLIPLPADADHPEPFAVAVSPARLIRLLGSYRCEVELKPRAASVLSLQYNQFAPSRSGRYLLSTTAPWRRPLRRAKYHIVPHGVTITQSNYPLRLAGGRLEFSRSDFLPAQDWTFSWR